MPAPNPRCDAEELAELHRQMPSGPWTRIAAAMRRIRHMIPIALLALLVAIAFWKTSGQNAGGRQAVVLQPRGIMGTSCQLIAVPTAGNTADARRAVALAQQRLLSIEARMSTWIDASEVSQFNLAQADCEVPLSRATQTVLRASRQAFGDTGGAFDITCCPLIELWRRAESRGVVPGDQEIAAARRSSNWALIELTEHGAIKRAQSARVDLGGIAKGDAIDRAVAAMQTCELAGGMVDVGGDLRCFGTPPAGTRWTIQIRDPFSSDVLTDFQLREGAVCTSGNYARYLEIAGQRYSHIIDPCTGRPAVAAPSVTTIAATARLADIWATALSVQGPDGLARLPGDVHALLVVGTPDSHHVIATAGFRSLLPADFSARAIPATRYRRPRS